MTHNYNYPYRDGFIINSVEYFKAPLKVTEDIIPQLEEGVAILPPVGKYIAVKVGLKEWVPPPVPVQYNNEEECRKACDIHNKWICDIADWDYGFVTEIINKYYYKK